MEINRHYLNNEEMLLVIFDGKQVIVQHFDGRLHIDVKGFPVGYPMTICIEDATIFDQDAPEPPTEAWDRHYGMYSNEGEADCFVAVQNACNALWPLGTTREDLVEYIQKQVSDIGSDRKYDRVSAFDNVEVWDTTVRENIHEAIDAFIDGSKR
jgi:hypothetical protein